jgi:hypothetical protein
MGPFHRNAYRRDLSRVGQEHETRAQTKISQSQLFALPCGRKTRPMRLEHDPEKWEPVFRKDRAQNNKLKRNGDST